MNTQATSQTIISCIEQLVDINQDKAALKNFDKDGTVLEEISYKELLGRLQIAANWLLSKNIKPGDVIGIAMHNSPDLLVMSWAAWSVGIITAPLDMKRDTMLQHEYKLTLCRAKMLVTQAGVFNAEEKAMLKIPVSVVEDIDWTNEQTEISWQKNSSETSLILFTSGTTSHPKGARLSMKNLLVNAAAIHDWLHISGQDTFLVNLPLHHINSTTFCLATLLGGGTIAIIPNYSNSQFWLQIATTGATVTSIVQSICFDQLAREKEFDAVKDQVKLTRIQIGSAPVVTQDLKKFMEMYQIKFYQGYGQTETALRVTGVPMDISEELYMKLVDTNSIGIAMSWADLQILDENGTRLGPNEEGELAVKGPAVMAGYLGDVPAFNTDGYFLTGDIGYFKEIDGRKYFYLKGRKKEIIIKGGINISPVAVENQLKELSQDISQVYVIGVPDARYGEEVGAVICWKEGIDQDLSMLKLKQTLFLGTDILSTYEAPKYLVSYDANDLPTTSTGKIQRSVLKDTIGKDRFSDITEVVTNHAFHFFILTPQSPYLKDAFALYNTCWQPLTVTFSEYKKYVSTQMIIAAVRPDGSVAGTIAYVRTNLSEEELSRVKYNKFIDPKNKLIQKDSKSLVCVAICSDNFKPQRIPKVDHRPSPKEVEAYLAAGSDGVFSFHQKPKGGALQGASLVAVIENGRSEDKSSCGYTMLLKYPEVKSPKLSENVSVSINLIETVMLVGSVTNGKVVYALSRPGGLASYLTQKMS